MVAIDTQQVVVEKDVVVGMHASRTRPEKPDPGQRAGASTGANITIE